MRQTPIGLIIRELAKEKNLSANILSERAGKSRPTIYQTFGRAEMTDTEVADWAKILGVTKDELFKRWKQDTNNTDGGSTSTYLMEHLANLEAQFKEFREQLQVKDMQIASLQRMLEMTLGKSEDVIIFKTTPVLAMYPGAGALEA